MTASAGSGASPARDEDTRLAEIAARAEAATPGPWGTVRRLERTVVISEEGVRLADGLWHDARRYSADAEFIAAARDDVPWLLAEVERLRAENQRKAFCEHCGNYHLVIHHVCCEPTVTDDSVECR